jgi:CRISPR-associated protein Cmr2
MTDNDDLWKTKLAAWLHDPAEKALILLRDREGHEWGTVRRLREELGISHEDLPKKADWYASAADRPQFPLEAGGQRYASWTQVDFVTHAVLEHPLTATDYGLGKLDEISTEHLKAVSEDHFRSLAVKDENDRYDLRRTLLNYWRFGPESPAEDLNLLWQNLPADTRIPDHSIWAHLDIVSAFAGAMAADGNGTPALLAVSFGPVQGFIAEARSTSDLWAGSHLLARIAWEGMRVVCERLGPDAVLFPNLRGAPLVDVWLRDEVNLSRELFADMDWVKSRSDANPLFGAALPNRFVALVPADQAQRLAKDIEGKVRAFVLDTGTAAIRKILDAIGEPDANDLPCYRQLDEQLQGFPDVYWAAVPWSLAESRGKPDDARLREVLSNFHTEGGKAGFLDSPAWQVLRKEVELDGARFYRPNAGTLYPALYELLDRVAAASKSARPFGQLKQHGYRSTLNGEREWLTLDRDQLAMPRGQRGDTLWSRLAERKASWAKGGEHLDALNAIKRLWPTLFTEAVQEIVGEDVRRYVLSTHTLAMAVTLERWLKQPSDLSPKLKNLLESTNADRAALPRRMIRYLGNHVDARLVCQKLPGVLDRLKDAEDKREMDLLNTTEEEIHHWLGERPETYYGMILMDGDRMGAWLAGSEDAFQMKYIESWHPAIRASVRQRFSQNPGLEAYLESRRWPSPARHRAISEALNHFSLKVARFVMEDCFKGKLIYAGGDDVLAFVCVDDLLPAMTLLRYLYSGRQVPEWLEERIDRGARDRFGSNQGYLTLDKALLLTMGGKATASCGAVVAHHQAPLGHVMKRLRATESQAKNAGGRDAFSLKIIKRAGGEIGITDKWWRSNDYRQAPELLFKLMGLLSTPGVSRRATYHSVRWLSQLPPGPPMDMLKANLVYQFKQQGGGSDGDHLARELAGYAHANFPCESASVLGDMLMVGEFLARESRLNRTRDTRHEEDTA